MEPKKPISRRELLRSKLGLGLAQSIGYAMGQAYGVRKHIEKVITEPVPDDSPDPPAPELAVYHRPPGAIDEMSFTAQCTKCNACIDACPPKTLRPLDGIYGKAFETPVVDPNLCGCIMCEDRPCASACKAEGIDIIDALLPPKMGHAIVHRSACRSHIGEECSLCIDICPIEQVIAHDWRKIPVIDADTCTGCGLCVHSCPVDPPAISIIPLRDRPSKPDQLYHDQNAQGPSPD
ncbi:MAG: 4Fe-4S dicluster domain-containing protein [Phycisphaerales bacterium]